MSRTPIVNWRRWVPELRELSTAQLEDYRRHCTGMLNGMCGYTYDDGGRTPVRREWLAKRTAVHHILAERDAASRAAGGAR
jgi:hypothetical protein